MRRILAISFFVIGILSIGVFLFDWLVTPLLPKGISRVLSLGVTAVAWTIAIFAGLNEAIEFFTKIFGRQPERPSPGAPITARTVEELLLTLGRRDGAVRWVDRGATSLRTILEHNKIAIVGERKVGKSRETISLFERLIDDGKLEPDRIYVPELSLVQLSTINIREQARAILGTRSSAALFIDDFALQHVNYSDEWLEKLRACVDILDELQNGYAVATARKERLTDEQETWLRDQDFRFIKLSKMDSSHIEEVSKAGSEEYQLELAEEGLQALVEDSDGTPAFTLLELRRLSRNQVEKVNAEDIADVHSASLMDAWVQERRVIRKDNPGAGILIDALADFYASKVPAFPSMVFAYAQHLRDQPVRRSRALFWWRRTNWETVLAYLVEQYEFSVVDDEIRYPEVSLEAVSQPAQARGSLAVFFSTYRRWAKWTLLKRLHRKSVEHGLVLLYLAALNADLEEPDWAINLYNVSSELYPHDVAYNNRGLLYSELGQHERAIQDYDEALRIDPHDAITYSNRAGSYGKLGKHERAIQDYDEALRINPQLVIAYNNRAGSYDHLGQHERAIQDFSEALRIDSQYAIAYNNRGMSFDDLGQHERAIQDFNEALRIDPQLAIAYNNRGRSYDDLGQHERAIQDFNEALRIDPQYAIAYYNRGRSYDKLGQHERAIQDFDEALRIDPQYAIAYNSRAGSYDHLGQHERAIQDYDEALRIDPQLAIAYYNRGIVYKDLGDDTKSNDDFQKAKELGLGLDDDSENSTPEQH